MPEQIKRNVAYKLRIGDLSRAKQVVENERLGFLDLDGKKIIRVNIVANIIEKYESEGESKYLSLTIDDASGQIRLKAFGDDVARFSSINQGDTILVIGTVRSYNNELYIAPEIIKSYDPRYLLVRKLELEASAPKTIDKQEIKEIKDKLLEMIKAEEEGIDAEHLIMNIQSPPETINQELHKLLEEGIIYEPRPGKFRYLG
jgi:RPA family protein